ncbi:MAG: hypothetical protein J5764_00855, partial [Bacteroidales bacterium]|nr:hypothetical protein [Bacteroidales bacterium]
MKKLTLVLAAIALSLVCAAQTNSSQLQDIDKLVADNSSALQRATEKYNETVQAINPEISKIQEKIDVVQNEIDGLEA